MERQTAKTSAHVPPRAHGERGAPPGSLEAVYQSALKCVQYGIGVDRASLLLFDASDKMRFVAWSERGRGATANCSSTVTRRGRVRKPTRSRSW